MVVGQQARKAMLGECPKKVARLIDLVNLPSNLREFAGGQSQMGHLSFFIRVWSHIKTHNLQVSSTTSFPSPLDNVMLMCSFFPSTKNVTLSLVLEFIMIIITYYILNTKSILCRISFVFVYKKTLCCIYKDSMCP
ncbi:unnamed protein product [Musa textilis]